MSSAIYFGDDSDSDVYDPDDTTLPFPKPLDRSTFLQPDFSAAEYLSQLENRFQTLEDLQSELQDLLKSLNKELVDLVNDNYTDFLSLGDRLRGGEERIEEIRVGLLGFQRDVGSVRALVNQRSIDIRAMLDEKRSLRKDIRFGRIVLDLHERLEELEVRLGLSQRTSVNAETNEPPSTDEDEISGRNLHDWDEIWARGEGEDSHSDSDLSDNDVSSTPRSQADLSQRLARDLEQFRIIEALARKCSDSHPFLLAQRDRMSSARDALRKRLEAEIRSQPNVQAKQRMIKVKSELDG